MAKVWTIFTLLAGSVACAPAKDSLTVDVDYAVYQGVRNNGTGLNVWKGIRYAAPPVGNLRWRTPQSPETVRNKTISANDFGPICPQSFPSIPNPPFIPGDEDCLFLNVYAPSTDKKLPVLVWIHGGGYGLGDGRQDLSEIINANGKSFIGISIQYRLGAFGFLSSDEVKQQGALNAGLLDTELALKWVQTHASKFGGDPRKVTISGESAGGGAVMLFGIARDGRLGDSLYRNGIAASPWLPVQYDYNHATPTAHFRDFASKVGCGNASVVLDCLRKVDSLSLQQASNSISTGGTYATWAFLPVTDGSFITNRPSIALKSKKLNGKAILAANNANEGALFVLPNINTLDDLKTWLHLDFPALTPTEIQKILDAYPSTDSPVDPTTPRFATNGLDSPTAVNMSQVASGQQQRAYNIHAEARFVCPSYWLNNAYTSSYHYQYSVPFASHGDDVPAYFGPSTPNQSASFSLAIRKIWGKFIVQSNPSVSSEPAVANWPKWSAGDRSKLVNLNTTGGVPYQAVTQFGATVTQFREPGVENRFSVVDAWEWEGGRGKRCEFWRSLADRISI
ncbi:Alpha/Beta hydrolase protein [Dendryphion nanum]|uniref:Carboxylic ester hydrolase n=1 Tax=Dendryphion nanum TaxID=256645 RepID=A0A9P9IEL7_9PLEO|nr:Alpha/Beta hydrolase protein [Dendryphion nanum]